MPLGVSVGRENQRGGETLLALGSVWALRSAFCFSILCSSLTPSLICFPHVVSSPRAGQGPSSGLAPAGSCFALLMQVGLRRGGAGMVLRGFRDRVTHRSPCFLAFPAVIVATVQTVGKRLDACKVPHLCSGCLLSRSTAKRRPSLLFV